MKTIKSLALLLAIVLGIGGASAKKNTGKVFYDSKSWIINVFGDSKYLMDEPCAVKIHPFSMWLPTQDGIPTDEKCEAAARILTSEGYGRKVIDILTSDGTSENILRGLALANVQLRDMELSKETLRSASGESVTNILAEDYLPVLMHNYIVVPFRYEVEEQNPKTKQMEKKVYVHEVLYRVDVDSEQAFDIMSAIGDPERYNKLEFKVSYCTTHLFYEDIIKDVPDFAVRGVITRRNPAQINMGSNMGLKKGQLVSVYGQRVDKQGEPYSKRVSRARVCAVWPDSAQINFESRIAGNRKNGDVVVITPDKHTRFGILATWQPHIWGGEILMDCKTGFKRSGVVHHFLMDLGFAMTDHPGDEFAVVSGMYEGSLVKAPIFANIGMGYGFGKTFLGYLDVMPFLIPQFELAPMFKAGDDKDANDLLALGIRVPIGIRFSFNIHYPTKLVLEAGYAFNCGIGETAKIAKESLKYMDARRDGIFLNLGFMF